MSSSWMLRSRGTRDQRERSGRIAVGARLFVWPQPNRRQKINQIAAPRAQQFPFYDDLGGATYRSNRSGPKMFLSLLRIPQYLRPRWILA